MKRVPITIHRFETWDEAKSYLSDFPTSYAFRGQKRSRWGLESSLERAIRGTRQSLDEAEVHCVRSFRREAHHYIPGHQVPQNELEWFALMQHYGSPTRLLDWSRSPYIAAYFALEDSTDTDDPYAAVWAVDVLWCKAIGIKRLQQTLGSDSALSSTLDMFTPDYYSVIVRSGCSGVFPVEPLLYNARLAAQQGLFLCPGNPSLAFERNLASLAAAGGFEQNVHKIEVKNNQRGVALADLKRMNISRATLFPGLDGFAQSLKYDLAFRNDSRYGDRQVEAWRKRNLM